MPQLYFNRILGTPKCLLLTAVCSLIIVTVLFLHRDRLSTRGQAATSNSTSNNQQGDSVLNMMKQKQHEQIETSWVEQQERDLAELLALAKCDNTLPSIESDESGNDKSLGLKLLPLNDWSVMCRGISIERDFDSLMRPHCRDRYLLLDYTYCSGLGNQMYRLASMYGIGRAACRRPIFVKGVQECVHGERKKELWRHHDRETPDEIERIFPLYSTQLKYVDLNAIKPSDIHYIEGFSNHCCKYDDPGRLKLHQINEKYVQLKKVDYLQNYKFFDGRRKDMRKIFQFSPNVCKNVLSAKCKLFESDRSSHKLCVHNRLSDFIQSGWASDFMFTLRSIEYIINELKPKYGGISVLLLGAEKDFLHKIQQNLNKTLYTKMYIPESSSRGEDLAFATIACNSMLITAPASTFSWWMAYLMPDNSPIYYSAHLEKTYRGKDNFLKEWIPLRLIDGKTIIRDG
ncbi:hypothetical protein niasHS_005152 [Heterodera schachtii]|uniref:L-Fucosyltransferase n=1 Tax=Heterodera schachtii TaxID=97005 RepID=A0ABD2JRL6_HETSC